MFFFLTILLLPTQLGKHFFPDWALVLGRRIDYLSPTVYLTDITILLTLVSWLFSQKKYFRISIGHWYLLPACRLAGTLVLFVILNVVLSSSPFVSLYKWTKVLEFVLFGWYIIKTKPSFRILSSVLCLSVFYSSLIAVTQFFLQHSIGGPLWFLGERTFDITTPGIARILIQPSVFSHKSLEMLRSYATFPHPNVLGGFLAVTLPLLIYKSTNDKPALPAGRSTNKIKSIFFLATLIFGFIALILTFSRSAWIAGFAGFIGVLLIIKRKKILDYCLPNSKAGIIGLLVLIGLFTLLYPYFQPLTSENESIFVRNELNSAAISMWWNSSSSWGQDNSFLLHTSYFIHRLVGVGLGNFLVELPKYYPHREIFFLQPVHNIYLLLLSEIGIIGLGIVLYLLFKIFKYIARKRLFVICLPAIGSRRRQVQAGYLSFVILLLLGAVDHYPLTLQQGQLLLTILISFILI
jgi:O-antigen ligase